MSIATKAANSYTGEIGTWSGQTNAYGTASDDSYATHTQASRNGEAEIDYGFPTFGTGDIPDGATINSVKVSAEVKLSASIGSVIGITIENPSGTARGTQTTTSSTSDTVIESTATTVPSLQNLRDQTVIAHFLYDRANSPTSETVSIDYVSITVDYTASTTTTANAGVATASAAGTAATEKISAWSGSGAATPAAYAAAASLRPWSGLAEVAATAYAGTAEATDGGGMNVGVATAIGAAIGLSPRVTASAGYARARSS